jgi:hypothetical protein
MSRHSLSTAAAIVCTWGAMLMAHGGGRQAAPGEAPNARELTVTGCLSEGTSTGVYILTNVMAKPDIENIAGTFRLVSGGADVDFSLHANHQVQTTGTAKLGVPPEPPPGGRIDPRDLPAFAVKTIQNVSERCLTGATMTE